MIFFSRLLPVLGLVQNLVVVENNVLFVKDGAQYQYLKVSLLFSKPVTNVKVKVK